ncbi:MAG TPA: GNAT family protein, partial [Roseiflexaceae bacterium]|nr:GNAT family protein [Roseiflexaceae bacterium]
DLAALLQVTLPDGWPHFPEAFSPETSARLESDPALLHWYGYFFIHRQTRALVGSGGFGGPPDEQGIVEIGYEIAPAHQNRGFATAAAQALIAHAFSHAHVTAVIAHTLAETNASNAVLQKAGMTFVGALEDPEHGSVWRWHITRAF